ncbi:YidE/YbjL duplication [Treponema brennaborense]|uniref:YidE/YbjL duplication n=1 Tax=Treponema brennaborense (strain DSM 12168 / CIP 105900 / DD5/3) TaxID=906968 RepID=F4LJR2_TREBD|nr:YidE/YbjL duplication [Treponema brennaborense]AEE17442.1 YidE/YbjL duplication [Treponema brennaborense DSM 12168]
MEYVAGVGASLFSTIFIIFTVGALGHLVGGISVKGISLGSAGVLLIALAYGILLSYVPSFSLGGREIVLYSAVQKTQFSLVSNIGTALFVTAVGLIAGPKFFRTLNRKSLAYIVIAIVVIGSGVLSIIVMSLVDKDLSPELLAGLLTGALTSTPGLSAAKEVAASQESVIAGYGIAYLFGVLGVVLFVQIVPKLLKVDIAKEREHFVAANAIAVPEPKGKLIKLDQFGFFPFFLAISLGCIIGAIEIPGINFSLGTSGGTLVAGLIIGHFGHIGPLDCRIDKANVKCFRELGLILFLIGAGVPGGMEFVHNVRVSYFIFGAIITLVPMIIGFLVAKYVFKLSIFNNLGAITGGMTSTPALGALINTAGTDDVASAYAATYPVALVAVVLATKLFILFV